MIGSGLDVRRDVLPDRMRGNAMLLAYVDESGDTGPPSHGGSQTYTLGCVLVEASRWNSAFDELVALRRRLRSRFGIRIRDEIKANFLVRGAGPLRQYALGAKGHHAVYRAHLRTMDATHGVRAFAVVVDKRGSKWTSGIETFDRAWEGLLQRLERTANAEDTSFMIIHDHGEDLAIRKWARRARRYLTAGSVTGSGTRRVPATMLLEDPVPRDSQHSYFIQLADLVAYAGYRAHVAPPTGSSAHVVCPHEMWNELGAAIHKKATAVRPRSLPGVVIR